MDNRPDKVQPESRLAAQRPQWYRGVKLQTPSVAPRTSLATLRKAVAAAVTKNARALAGGK